MGYRNLNTRCNATAKSKNFCVKMTKMKGKNEVLEHLKMNVSAGVFMIAEGRVVC